MIDAVATPGFQTAINMPTKLDLHYDDSKISDVSVDIQCVHEMIHGMKNIFRISRVGWSIIPNP